MRKIIMFNRITVDGHFAGQDGNLDWVVPDEELDRAAGEAMPATDTVLFGRRTYEMFESFWPHVLDDAAGARDPHDSSRRSPEILAMATFLNEATKLLFSRSRTDVTWKNSRLVGEFEPTEIAAWKQEAGKDMIVFGSGSIVSQLSRHRLIDEYQFVVNPVLLGSGRQLVSGLSESLKLGLLEARATRSGNVRLRYARAN